jgi:hypothetical protein
VNVQLSDRARREAQRIDASWREQADFPELFLDELLETVGLIETTGVLGAVYGAKTKRRVHRLLMEKSGYHVYLVSKSHELVVVVSIWNARRGRGPKL